jgi:hypothetical protein
MRRRSRQNIEKVVEQLEVERYKQEQERIIRTEIFSSISQHLQKISLFRSKPAAEELYKDLCRLWDNDIKVEALYSLLEDFSMVPKISYNEFKAIATEISDRLYPPLEADPSESAPSLAKFNKTPRLATALIKPE